MFSPQSSIQEPIVLIPAGTLSKAVLVVREIKYGKQSGAGYLDVELRLFEGQHEGRIVFDMIMDPFDSNASEGGKKMGILVLTRICEAIGIFSASNPTSYERYAGPGVTIQDVVSDIDGQTVAVKFKIEKGTNGYADKNKVAEWLTPNPNSGTGFKDWQTLVTGAGNPAARQTAFSSPQALARTVPQQQAPNATPAWLNKPQ